MIDLIKGCLFDMDGLMVDTERLSLDSWAKAAEEMDFRLDLSALSKIRGRNRQECIRIFNEEFNINIDFNEIMDVKNKYMDAEMEKNGLPIKKGLTELLDFLKSEGIKAAVASSTNTDLVIKRLKLGGLQDYFDVVIGGDQVENSKPAPDIYQMAARGLGLNPSECIGLEDSPAGIRSAFSAGCYVIAIPDLDPIEGNIKEKCNEVLADLSEVISSIRNLRGLEKQM